MRPSPAVALAIDHAAAVRGGDGGTVDPAQRVPAGLDGREVGLRDLVVRLVVARQGVRQALGQGHGLTNLAPGLGVDAGRPARRGGKVHRGGDDDGGGADNTYD